MTKPIAALSIALVCIGAALYVQREMAVDRQEAPTAHPIAVTPAVIEDAPPPEPVPDLAPVRPYEALPARPFGVTVEITPPEKVGE